MSKYDILLAVSTFFKLTKKRYEKKISHHKEKSWKFYNNHD